MNRLKVFFVAILFAQIARCQDTSTVQTPEYYQALATVAKVESTNNLSGNFNPDSVTTLPFGIVKEIGVARYIIAIDSAMFAPGKSTFSAYMAIDFPGSAQKLAFAAKNVNMNPKGVIPGYNTRLALVSEHKIHIGPNITLVLKDDGSNYVEWDCNGFKGINLKGYFEFERSILTPDTLSNGNNKVTASFNVYTTDIHNFITQVSITPFYISGLHDVSFSVVDAIIDMSDFQNYPGMVFPQGYNYTATNGQTSLWTGFYMKQLKIKIPKEISKNNVPAEFLVTDFLIDKSGLTGKFLTTNLFSVGEGKMGKWGFSIDQLGLSFVSNTLAGGTLGGKIMLPTSETSTVGYTASVFHNYVTHKTDYLFTLSPANGYTANVLSAELDIYPTSKLIVQKINGAFKPSVELNGRIKWKHDYLKTTSLEMQQVIIKDEAPYLVQGIFGFTDSLGSGASTLSGFDISFSNISLSVSQNAPVFNFGAGISFTSQNDLAFGAQATFAVVTKLTTIINGTGSNSTTNNKKWSFDKVLVNDIGINVHTCAFQFDGVLKFRNNDPQYGNGFMASLTLSIDKIMPNPAGASAWFGNANNFKYYYFDVAIPTTIVVVPPGTSPVGIAIYRFMGGLFYHMRPAATNPIAGLYGAAFNNARSYIPDNTQGVGVKAGVTFGAYPKNEIFNADAGLEVIFTPSGGLGTIKFSGSGFGLVKVTDRVPTLTTTPPIKLGVSLLYDHQNDIIHAVASASVALPAVSAQGQAELHIDKTTWYAYLGKPDNRVVVSLAGLASVNAYVMLGNQLEPLPPPPPAVTDKFGHGFADTRDMSKIQNAEGLVLGAWLGVSNSGGFGWTDFNVYYGLDIIAGFDVMAVNYGPNAHCSGSSARAGFNGWYAQGDVYAALSGIVGARGKFLGANFDVELLSVSAAAMLGGKFPNPSSVNGEIALDYNFLDTFSGHLDCSFQVGQTCSVTN